MKFKILFPSNYQINDVLNDNIDVHVVLKNGDVFFGTVFTILNIQDLMSSDAERSYFWSTNMIILKNLTKGAILKAIDEVITNGYLEHIFDKIGDIEKVYSNNLSFEQLEGISGGSECWWGF